MKFYSRKWIKPEDLNPNGNLFGGQLLSWIDEEAAIYAACQVNNRFSLVTKFISEVDFKNPASLGDIIEMGMEFVKFGKTSLTIKCIVRNKVSKDIIISIEKIIFVSIDTNGNPTPHGVENK